ncbi:hypothetical protein Lal_00015029 [Lupinus albus]|nr:hypothetical protein Lal_00015029 [Lupinus albus]
MGEFAHRVAHRVAFVTGGGRGSAGRLAGLACLLRVVGRLLLRADGAVAVGVGRGGRAVVRAAGGAGRVRRRGAVGAAVAARAGRSATRRRTGRRAFLPHAAAVHARRVELGVELVGQFRHRVRQLALRDLAVAIAVEGAEGVVDVARLHAGAVVRRRQGALQVGFLDIALVLRIEFRKDRIGPFRHPAADARYHATLLFRMNDLPKELSTLYVRAAPCGADQAATTAPGQAARGASRHPARTVGPGLCPSDPDPGQGDPHRPAGPRRHGRRPDRHRQDGELLAADHPAAAPACQHEHVARAPCRARPRADADARTGDPGRRERQGLCPAHAAALHRRLRRHGHEAADRDPAPRRRDRHRDAGPPARPRGAEEHQPGPGPDARDGRSRPHARHGLPARPAAHHQPAAQEAPEPDVLGHVLARDQEAGVQLPERPADDRSRAQQRHQHLDHPGAVQGRRRAEAQRRRAPDPRARPEAGAGLLEHEDRRVAPRALPRAGRHQGFGHPRRQDPAGADRRAGRVQERRHRRARRDRRRGARPRHHRPAVRDQLRPAVQRRGLRAPHRPHGPRGRHGRRAVRVFGQGRAPAGRHRKADQADDHARRADGLHAVARRRPRRPARGAPGRPARIGQPARRTRRTHGAAGPRTARLRPAPRKDRPVVPQAVRAGRRAAQGHARRTGRAEQAEAQAGGAAGRAAQTVGRARPARARRAHA